MKTKLKTVQNIVGQKFGGLFVKNVYRSRTDDVYKIVFGKSSDERIVLESVDFSYSKNTEGFECGRENRWVLCISTQSGCPVACKFCGTGSRYIDNLCAEDIVQQVSASEALNHRVNPNNSTKFQIMFMAMGEPTLNADETCRAIEMLHEEYPKADLLIATMGANKGGLEKFINLAEQIPNLGLQFSLHGTSDEERSKIIPYPQKLSIDELSKFGIQFHEKTGRLTYLNFIMFPGNEDFGNNLRELLHNKFSSKHFHITISYAYDTPFEKHGYCKRETFENLYELLKKDGYETSIFKSAGIDIGAGCGQLWYVQSHLLKYGKTMPWAEARVPPGICRHFDEIH